MKLRPVQFGAIVLILAIVPLVVATWRNDATFDITAESEYVRYEPELDPVQHWVMDSVSLFDRDEPTAVIVSGDLQFTDSVQVTVERRSEGPLVVEIEPTRGRQKAGGASPLRVGVFRERSGVSRPLYDNVVIEMADVGERSRRGKPIVFAMRGSVRVGRSIQREPDANLGLLRSGKVTKFASALVGKTVVVAGSRDLDLGDEVTIDRPLSPELGLVRADERPALSVAYRADAQFVQVQRPGGGHYRIHLHPAERAVVDLMLQAWWTVLVFLFGVVTWLLGFAGATTRKKADEAAQD